MITQIHYKASTQIGVWKYVELVIDKLQSFEEKNASLFYHSPLLFPCHGLNVCVPPKSICWSVTKLGDEITSFEELIKDKWGHNGEAWSYRIGVLKRDVRELTFSAHRGHMNIQWEGSHLEAHNGTCFATPGSWTSKLQKLWGINFSCWSHGSVFRQPDQATPSLFPISLLKKEAQVRMWLH